MSQPMTFTKATKSSCLLRAALFGPSGAGKTYTALRIATGLGGRIAVVDTERGSASKYADRFGFDVLELQKPTIANYVAAIEAAAAAGYRVLVTDSLSHPWHELLQEVDRLASAKYQGNTWSAWSEGTPKQRRLIDAILGFPGHVIATMRSKTEWSVESGKGGKTKPVRVGLAPEQGKGIEYEFDLLLELSQDHIGQVVKDRTGKFQDQILDKPGEDFGQALAAWLSTGPAPVRPAAAIPSDPTGVEPEPPANASPLADSPPSAQDEEVYRNIEKVVARAKLSGAWLTAENYLRARVAGEPLDYGLKLLETAKQEAQGATATAQAA